MAVKMQEEYGDRLNTIFVECQGSSMDDIRKLALEKQWLGTDAMWTKERPMVTGVRGIPNFVLLSPQGEVVMMGRPGSMHQKIEEYLDGLRRSRSKVPDGLHKDLKGVYKDYAKGKLGDAIKEARKIQAQAGDDAELAEACKQLLDEMTSVAEAAVSRLERATAEGAYSFVRERGKDLKKSLKGTDYEEKVAEQLKRLEDKSLAEEVKAEKALHKLERRLYSKGASARARRSLEKLAEKYQGTKAAERARKLADSIED